MSIKKIIPVILSGGSGKRLWPLSTNTRPKQFLDLGFDKTLFQMTLERIEYCELSSPIIICNTAQKELVRESLNSHNSSNYIAIIEPEQKNTAPAITMAVLLSDENTLLLTLPSDHLIQNLETFKNTVKLAYKHAQNGHIVTFGIPPENAHTGFGYIERGDEITKNAYKVARFHEKPNKATAEKYANSPDYYWNSGMFCFSAVTYLSELKKYNPELLTQVTHALENVQKEGNNLILKKTLYSGCQSISIDHAIMEKTDKAVVLPFESGWSDIGNWNSLWQASEKDAFNNVLHGNVMLQSGSENIIVSKNKPIHAIGVKDLIIIETDDGILIANKDMAEDIKNFV